MPSIKEIIAKYYDKIKDASDPVKKFRESEDLFASGMPSDSSEENPIARAKKAVMEEASSDTSKGLQKLGVDKKYVDYALPAASMLVSTLRPTGRSILEKRNMIEPGEVSKKALEKLPEFSESGVNMHDVAKRLKSSPELLGPFNRASVEQKKQMLQILAEDELKKKK